MGKSFKGNSTPAKPGRKQVISASRRTDIPMWYSRWLADRLREGQVEVALPYGGRRVISLKPGDVHTLVLWSKDFSAILANRHAVGDVLAEYDQLFCQFTITGLGGSELEPGVPPWEVAARQLPELIEQCGDPRRIAVRFDPIVHWHDHSGIKNNLPFAEPIFEECARHGITSIKTSFATLYRKVLRRSRAWRDPPPEEKLHIAGELLELADSLGLVLQACSDPLLEEAGIPPSRCIDGKLLSQLHPKGLTTALGKDRGQRRQCNCTESADVGSYGMRCPGGCLYCYASPVIRSGLAAERS